MIDGRLQIYRPSGPTKRRTRQNGSWPGDRNRDREEKRDAIDIEAMKSDLAKIIGQAQ